MRTLFLMLLLVISGEAFSKPVPFSESFMLASTKCHAAAVNFTDGQMVTSDTDFMSAVCRKEKGLDVVCGFFADDGKKLVQTVIFNGAITGAVGVLESADYGHFILDLESGRFFSNEGINQTIKGGRIRGARLCWGEFRFQSELKKSK